MRRFKLLVLHVSKWLGLFAWTRLLFRKHLHILCYHGFQLRDECAFRPALFITPRTFESRLAYLQRRKIPVLPLDVALARLAAGTLPPGSAAITVDDGFRSTLTVAAPLLRRFAMPSMVYVTTYYVQKRAPVFRLALQYLFWAARVDAAAVRQLVAQLPELAGVEPTRGAHEILWKLIERGEAFDSEDARQELLRRVAAALSQSADLERRLAVFELLSPAELPQLAAHGIDVQLHTHRHRFPPAQDAIARREIEENRVALRAMLGRDLDHFCYPSGIYDRSQWPILASLGVASATTCESGVNDRATPIFGLKRFLDSEVISSIEFEAELAGFSEALRRIRRFFRTETTISVHHYD